MPLEVKFDILKLLEKRDKKGTLIYKKQQERAIQD